MAEMFFKVKADYEELVRLEKEIDNVNNKLKNAIKAGEFEGLQKYTGQLKELEDQFRNLADEAVKNGAVIKNYYKGQFADLAQNIKGKSQDIAASRVHIKQLSLELAKAEKAYQHLVKTKGKYAAKNSEECKEVARLKGELEEEKLSIQELSLEYDKLLLKRPALEQEAKEMGIDEEAKEETDALGDALDSLAGKLTNVTAIFAGGMSIGTFVNQVVQVRGQFQQLEIAFKTMLGSEQKANDLMAQLTKTAAITPFDLQGVAQGAKQLLAYGVQAEEVNETLTRLGDIAAGLSLPLSSLVYLYGTTMTQGRMFTQDLRQFMGRGIPLAEELAKQFGVTKNEVGALVTAGKVGAEEFKKAIWSMSDEGGKFGGLMEAQSKTITGQISNIEDAISSMFNDIGKESEGAINTALSGVSWLVENYKKLGKMLATLVTFYGTYKTIMIVVAALKKRELMINEMILVQQKLSMAQGVTLTAEGARDIVVTNLRTAAKQRLLASMKALYASTLANPYAIAAVAVTALAYGIYECATNADAATKAQEGWNKTLDEFNQKADENKQKIDGLIQTIRSADSTSLSKYLAYDELKKVAPALAETYKSVDALANADLSSLNKQVGEFKDNLNEEEIKKKIERLNELKQVFAYGDIGMEFKTWKAGTALQDEFNVDVSRLFDNRHTFFEITNSLLNNAQKSLEDFNKAKEKANTPLEVQVRVAKADLEKATTDLNLVSDLIVAMKKDAKNNPIKVGIDANYTTTQTDVMVSKINKKIEELKRKQREHPIQFTTDDSKAMKMYQHLLSQIAFWKSSAQATGMFDIPILITTTYKTLETQQGEAKVELDEANDAKKAQEEAEKKAKAEEAKRKAREAADKARQEREKQEAANQRVKDMLADQKQKNLDAEIELEQDAFRKKMRQIDNNYKKQLKTIADWEEKLRNENKAAKIKTNESGLTTEQEKASKQAKDNARTKKEQDESKVKEDKSKAEQDRYKKEEQAMIDYLSKYGELKERRVAIEKDYNRKIAEATTEGDRIMLQEKKRKELNDIDFAQFKQSIDWESIFSGLEYQTNERLVQLKGQLRELLGSNELGIEGYKSVVTQIDAINEQILKNESERSRLLGWELPTLQEKKRLLADVNEAEKTRNELIAKRDELGRSVDSQRNNITGLLNTYGVKGFDGTVGSAQTILNNMKTSGYDEDSVAYNEVRIALEKFATSTNEATEAEKKAEKATDDYTNKQGKLSKFLGSFEKSLAIFVEGMEKANANIQELPALGESLGIDKDSKAGQKIQGIADIANNSLGAAKDFMSGNYVGAAVKALGTIGTLGKVLGIGGESDKTYAENMEKLSNANGVLKDSINKLSDKMEHSSLIDALNAFQKQMANYEQLEKNMQEQLVRSGKSYDSGFWGTGIGGERSTNTKINKGMDKIDWDMISKVTGKSVRSAEDLWKLNSEQMAKISTDATTQWIKLLELADDGHQDMTKYLEEYITLYELQEQAQEKIKQKNTATTFDSLVSNFQSAVMDMNKTSADFANDFESLMKNAMMSALISNEFNKGLEEWYERFNNAMEGDGLSQEEQEALRKEYMDMTEEAKKKRDTMYESMGWSDNASQGAQSKGFATMSQDTANELNGRFTAMQIAMERVAMGSDASLVSLAEMSNTMHGYYPNIIAIGEGVLRQQAESYIELQQINERTEGWNKPMRKAFDNIEKMARKIETL